MSIAAMSVAMKQQQVNQSVGISTMKMAMGAMQDTGDLVSALADSQALQQAAQPYMGANVDVLA